MTELHNDSQESNGENDVFLAIIATKEYGLINKILQDSELDFGCRPHVRQLENGFFELPIFATEKKLEELKATSNLKVEVKYNASVKWRKQLQKKDDHSDRFDGGRIVPRGLGLKTKSKEE